jgi:hypothetical protein
VICAHTQDEEHHETTKISIGAGKGRSVSALGVGGARGGRFFERRRREQIVVAPRYRQSGCCRFREWLGCLAPRECFFFSIFDGCARTQGESSAGNGRLATLGPARNVAIAHVAPHFIIGHAQYWGHGRRGHVFVFEIDTRRRIATQCTFFCVSWRVIACFRGNVSHSLLSHLSFRFIQYHLFTQTIHEANYQHVSNLYLAMQSLAQTITMSQQRLDLHDNTNNASTSSTRRTSFPFVHLDSFQVPGQHALQFSGVEYVTWNPLVRTNQRPQWSQYVTQEFEVWYNQSKHLATTTSLSETSPWNPDYDTTSTIRDFVWSGPRDANAVVTESTSSIAAPIWQCSPPPASAQFLNYDILSDPLYATLWPVLQAVARNGDGDDVVGVWTAVDASLAVLPDTFASLDFQETYHGRYSTTVHNSPATTTTTTTTTHKHVDEAPHAAFVFPVYDSLDENEGVDKEDTTTETDPLHLVGLVVSNVAFDYFVANLLPDNVVGITAVLHNTCNQSYTYTLQGRQVCGQ